MYDSSAVGVARAVHSGVTHIYQHPADLESVERACTAGLCRYVPAEDEGVHCFVVRKSEPRLGLVLTDRGKALFAPAIQTLEQGAS